MHLETIKRVGHVSLSFSLPNQIEKILIFGGYVENESTGNYLNQPVNSFYCDPAELLLFDPESYCWSIQTTTGQVPPANSGTCGVVFDNSLYIYGGYFSDPDLEGNSNNLYQLNLLNWTWKKLEPTGSKPLHRDKLVGWEWNKKIFFFGGFGTAPPSDDTNHLRFEYISDRSHSWFVRGWNNQLAAFNIDLNQWEYPTTTGHTPSPRAALSGFICRSKAYLFGGRLLDARMNDFYSLDMESMTWSENLNVGNLSPYPCGRSWHSFTLTSSTNAILYGGLSSDGEVLGDCWIYNTERNTWTELQLQSQDRRLWHQSVYIDKSLFVIGGVRTNLLRSNEQEPTVHCDSILVVPVAPKTLLRLCVEFCSSFFLTGSLDLGALGLPIHLQRLLKIRDKYYLFKQCRP